VLRLALVLVCALALPVSTARAWTWPVDGPIVRPFVFDHDAPYTAGQHRGIDIGVPSGVQVRAPAEGVVSFVGTVPAGGKTISIQTPFGYTATLLHLGSVGVKRGASVREGDLVGASGSESYVYFGVRATRDPQGYVDPLGLLPAPLPETPPPVEAEVAQAAAEPSAPAAEATAPVVPEPVAVVSASPTPQVRDGFVVFARTKPAAVVAARPAAQGSATHGRRARPPPHGRPCSRPSGASRRRTASRASRRREHIAEDLPPTSCSELSPSLRRLL
jgi:peptidase M23-like protein